MKNLALYVSALCCWILLMFVEDHLFDGGVAPGFGIFSAIVVVLAFRLVDRWSRIKIQERAIFFLAISISIAGGSYLVWVDYGYGLHKTRAKIQQAERL